MFFWVVWLFCKYLNRLKIPESSVPAEIQLQPRFCPWIQPSQCFQFNQGFVDPNTSNLYPDPAFWSNLNPDQDPIPGLCYKLWRKKIKNNFREKQLSLQKIYSFGQLSQWIVNLCLKSYICASPDPQSYWIRIQYGSGSTTLVQTKLWAKILAIQLWIELPCFCAFFLTSWNVL